MALKRNSCLQSKFKFPSFLSTARFIMKNPHQTLIVGQSGNIECNAEGSPPPRFTWTRKDARALDMKRFIQIPNGNLKVIPVQLMDGGEYICTIKQNRGTKRVTSKPQFINVSLIGKKSIHCIPGTPLTGRKA